MPDPKIPALRAKVTAIRAALVSDALMPETANRFLRWLLVGHEGSRIDALLDAAEQRDRMLTALAEQEKDFYARSEYARNPDGGIPLDDGFRQGMGRVVTALRNAADGTGDDSDG